MYLLRLFPLVLALAASLVGWAPPTSAQIIDQARRVDWRSAGANRADFVSRPPCVSLTATATAAQINSALASCPEGKAVYLEAGTYQLSGGIDFAGRSGVTLRGAGPDKTILNFTAGVNCFGFSADVCVRNLQLSYSQGPAYTASWTSGYAAGTTSIQLSSTTGIQPGTLLLLDQQNDASDSGQVFVCSTLNVCSDGGPGGSGRPGREQVQMVRVTGVSGNQVTFTPGLYMQNWRTGQAPGAWWSGHTIERVSIEDLTLNHAGSAANSGIVFFTAYGSMVSNVRSLVAGRNHVWIYQSKNLTVRDSYFFDSKTHASTSYGVEVFTASDSLIENNIIHRITAPIIFNGPASGSVVGYNYVFDSRYTVSDAWMQPTNYHHGAGLDMVLHEGNEGTGIIGDLVHGSHHLITAFRNRFTGFEPGKTAQTTPVHLYAFNRYFNIVGNVLGTEGYHSTYESGSPNGTNANQAIYTLGWSGNSGTTNQSVPNDSLVKATLLRWGNYDVVTGAAVWRTAEVPTGIGLYSNGVPPTESLPASLYLDSKPPWWPANLAWPAIGPDVSGGSGPGGRSHNIPAHICYDLSAKNSDGSLASYSAAACYAYPSPPTNLRLVQ